MKPTRLFLLLFILVTHSLFAEKVFDFPKEINSFDVTVRSINNKIVTVTSNNHFELWQFQLGTNKIISHFKPDQHFESKIYETTFNDGGITYKKVKHAYEVNHLRNPLYRVNKYYINSNNEVYTIVTGYEAKPATMKNPDGTIPNPEEDFEIHSFYTLIKFGNDGVLQYLPIHNAIIEHGYSLNGESDFYQDGNGFVFTISKPQITEGKNYVLGKWLNHSGVLMFDAFINVEISDFNKEYIHYGLLDFIYKHNTLMFYSCPNVYDMNSLLVQKLEVKDMPNSNLSGHSKGDVFDINFSVCDFYANDNTLKVILRKGKDLSVAVYDQNTFALKKETPIPNANTNDLWRFPFFTSEGELVLLPKKNGKIMIIHD